MGSVRARLRGRSATIDVGESRTIATETAFMIAVANAEIASGFSCGDDSGWTDFDVVGLAVRR